MLKPPFRSTPSFWLSRLALCALLALGSACQGELEETRFKADLSEEDASLDLDASSRPDLDQALDASEPDARRDASGVEDLADISPSDLKGDEGDGGEADSSDLNPSQRDLDAGQAGCPDALGTLSSGEQLFMLAGRQRRYMLRLPENYDASSRWPIVLALHGNGGNTEYWDSQGGTRDLRATLKQEAILVVAEAIDNQWRDYGKPDSWEERIELELEYFDTILAALRSELCVDEARIFAMGFSGGGSFSGVLGCRREAIRAIAAGGSVRYFEPSQCVNTPAAWITIGQGELTAGREAFRDFFRDRAGCEPERVAVSPEPCEAYTGCDPGSPVHYCQHDGNHRWPDLGDQAFWAFFSQF